MIGFIERWAGWGWTVLFLAWAAGGALVLTVVYRWFLERTASRLPTAAIFAAWTLVILGIGSTMLGFGLPPG